MYFGSVRFFKHLILGSLTAVFLLLIAAVMFFAVKSNNLARENSLLIANKSSSSVSSAPPVTPPPEKPKPIEYSFEYQRLYPDMYAEHAVEFAPRAEKTIYLTFDDGPSEYTDKLLKVLADNDVKATFFVAGIDSDIDRDRVLAMTKAGHTIGVHTNSHAYRSIYTGVESYLEDFAAVYNQVLEITGKAPDIFRFPGGSINTYNQHIYKELIAEMTRRGFTYYDWNLAATDTAKSATPAQVVSSVVDNMDYISSRGIVLLHDGYSCTVDALDTMIKKLREKGFSFAALDNKVVPITFSYLD